MKKFSFYSFIKLNCRLVVGFTSFKFSGLGLWLLMLFTFSAMAQEPKLMLPIGHTGAISSVQFSPDGKKIVTASWDGSAKIWDASTGLVLEELKADSTHLSNAGFSPDGKQVLTNTDNGNSKIWDIETGKLLNEFKNGIENAASFSINDHKLLTVGFHEAIIWNLKTGKKGLRLKGSDAGLLSAIYSPDCRKIITFSTGDQIAKIWNANTGKVLLQLNFGQKLEFLDFIKFSPNNKIVITIANRKGIAKIWDAETGYFIADLNNRDAISSITFSPDAKKIVTTSYEKAAKVWDATTGQALRSLNLAMDAWADDYPKFSQFSADGKKIITDSRYGPAKLWDVETGKLLVNFNDQSLKNVQAVQFSPNCKTVIVAVDGFAKMFDVETGSLMKELKGETSMVYTARFSNNSKMLVTVSDGSPKIWNAETCSFIANLKPRDSNDMVFAAEFTPTDKGVAGKTSDLSDKGAIIWDLPSKHILNISNLKYYDFNQYSPGFEKLVTPSIENTAKIWDNQTKTSLLVLKGHTAPVTTAQFSLDGKKIITTSIDGTAKIWNSYSGELLNSIAGSIKTAQFSPDAQRVISTSYFSSLASIWDPGNGKIIASLNGHSNVITSASFSNNGEKVVTSSEDNTCKLWSAKPSIFCVLFLLSTALITSTKSPPAITNVPKTPPSCSTTLPKTSRLSPSIN